MLKWFRRSKPPPKISEQTKALDGMVDIQAILQELDGADLERLIEVKNKLDTVEKELLKSKGNQGSLSLDLNTLLTLDEDNKLKLEKLNEDN